MLYRVGYSHVHIKPVAFSNLLSMSDDIPPLVLHIVFSFDYRLSFTTRIYHEIGALAGEEQQHRLLQHRTAITLISCICYRLWRHTYFSVRRKGGIVSEFRLAYMSMGLAFVH